MSTNTNSDGILTPGLRCSIPKSGNGTLAFVGQTEFAPGKWVGIVLDAPLGKNDGSVQGIKYFDALPGYGVFVRPGQVTVIESSEGNSRVSNLQENSDKSQSATEDRYQEDGLMLPPPTPAPRTPVVKRPSLRSSPSSGRPQTTTPLRPPSSASTSDRVTTTRTTSRAGSDSTPPPTQPRSAIVAAAKAAQLRGNLATPGSTRSTRTVTESGRVSATPSAAANRRQIQIPVNSATTTTPLSRRSSVVSNSNLTATSRPPSSAAMQRTLSSRSGGLSPFASPLIGVEESQSTEQGLQSPAIIGGSASPDKEKHDPFSLTGRGKERKPIAEQTVPLRIHEETLLRLKIIETRHAETRAQMKDYETLKEEHTQFNTTIKPKLQSRLLELASEAKELKKRATEAESERDRIMSKFDELQDEVELHTLDKEMAEEKAEAAEGSLAEANDRLAELQVEVQVLREQSGKLDLPSDFSDAPTADRSSIAFLQLERQNERLKEALSRLRDITSENDAEHRRRMSDLEKELELTADLQAECDDAIIRAEAAESQLEDLKLQLDDAMGAEDLLEQLTERNLTLSEKVEEMRAVVEDLEALKELNDELEENHVESEKQLLEEIETKDARAIDQQRRVDVLEESILNYDATISQFRDLVASMQADIDHMRDQQTAAEFDARNLSSQTQGMLDINLKLQSTVAKAQVKTLDLELRKMEARHAVEQLAAIKPYLPPIFYEADNDAVEALMFFDRLSRKSALISDAIANKHNLAESLSSVVSEHLVTVRGKLSRFSILTNRFAANLRRCSPDIFLKMGQAYRELFSVEKKLDVFVDQLRKDQLKEADCGREVDRFIAQAGHLAEVNLGESGLDLGEMQIGQALTLDVDFDTFIAGIGYSKQCVALIVKEDGMPETDINGLTTDVFEPFQTLIDQARSAQTHAKKMHRRLDTLLGQNEHLMPEVSEPLAELVRTVHLLGSSATANLTTRYCTELRATQQAVSVVTMLGIVSEATSDLGFRSTNVMAALDTELSLVGSRLAAVSTASADSNNATGVSYIAPWLERVAQIARASAVNVEAEQKASRLAEELSQVVRDTRVKDQIMQENAVKIELLEKRAEGVKHQIEVLADIETQLSKARKQEKAYEEAIEALNADLENLQKENAQLKQNSTAETTLGPRAGHGTAPSSGTFTAEAETVAFTGSLETAQLLALIESLRNTLRFVQKENAFLKTRDLAADLAALPVLRSSVKKDPVRTDQVRQVAQDVKLLWRETLETAAMPKLPDFSSTGAVRRRPGVQLMRQKEALNSLSSRMKVLTFEVEALGMATDFR